MGGARGVRGFRGAPGAHVVKRLSLLPLERGHLCKFLERMVRYRDVQEGEKHRSDTEMFGE